MNEKQLTFAWAIRKLKRNERYKSHKHNKNARKKWSLSDKAIFFFECYYNHKTVTELSYILQRTEGAIQYKLREFYKKGDALEVYSWKCPVCREPYETSIRKRDIRDGDPYNIKFHCVECDQKFNITEILDNEINP